MGSAREAQGGADRRVGAIETGQSGAFLREKGVERPPPGAVESAKLSHPTFAEALVEELRAVGEKWGRGEPVRGAHCAGVTARK